MLSFYLPLLAAALVSIAFVLPGGKVAAPKPMRPSKNPNLQCPEFIKKQFPSGSLISIEQELVLAARHGGSDLYRRPPTKRGKSSRGASRSIVFSSQLSGPQLPSEKQPFHIPGIRITQPAHGAVVNDNSPTYRVFEVMGEVDDPSIVEVTVKNGAMIRRVPVVGGAFYTWFSAGGDGPNTIRAEGLNADDERVAVDTSVILLDTHESSIVEVFVDDPNDPVNLPFTTLSPYPVTGSFEQPYFGTVRVNGVDAVISPDGLEFTADVPLDEGLNIVSASLVMANGNVGTMSAGIFLDQTPPDVFIQAPGDGNRTRLDEVNAVVQAYDMNLVEGCAVNDLPGTEFLIGFVSMLTVVGHAERAYYIVYHVDDIPLTYNVNQLEAVVPDSMGWEGVHQIDVEHDGTVPYPVFSDETASRFPSLTIDPFDVDAADVDGDGRVDLLFACDGQETLLMNQGGGYFSSAPAAAMPWDSTDSRGLRLVDLDGDGFADIVLANSMGDNCVYMNDKTGSFVDETVKRLPAVSTSSVKVAAGDLNNDTYPDLVFANSGDNTLMLNDGHGVFTDKTSTHLPVAGQNTCNVDLADVDGDQDLDIIFTDSFDSVRLLINDGAGKFGDETEARLPADLEHCAFDTLALYPFGDGVAHLYVSRAYEVGARYSSPECDGQDLFLHNDGIGVLKDMTDALLPALRHDYVWDVDSAVWSRGRQSPCGLALARLGANGLLHLEGGAYFVDDSIELPIEPAWSRAALFVDVDDDGDQDLIFARDSWSGSVIYINGK